MSTQIFLHHYPISRFSEKIRALLGYLGATWHSVETTSIMPRPLLMPLTGGYRRIPCLQIGANVYCDTAVIVKGLLRHLSVPEALAHSFVVARIAEWADREFFLIGIGLGFGSPESMQEMLSRLPAQEAKGFFADRANLAPGDSMAIPSLEVVTRQFTQVLNDLETSLKTSYLLGDHPTIADFSVYSTFWALRTAASTRSLTAAYPNINDWFERIASFGQGQVIGSSGEEALAHAHALEPLLPELKPMMPSGVSLGDRVTVTPDDYGKVSVEGELIACGLDEIVLARTTPETGTVMTHFPRNHFDIQRLD